MSNHDPYGQNNISTSIRNPESFRDTIEKITSDKVVSEVVIRTAAGTVTSIVSVEREQPVTARWRIGWIATKNNSSLQAALDAFYPLSRKRDWVPTLR